uniref:Amine oxidase n=1 Tax=Timema bartmani TaxID=61472 RepID=A0A7R9EWU8_9NEOP|nr:unnamed protein product [Timema bartmani]
MAKTDGWAMPDLTCPPTISPQFCCLYVDKNILGLSSARLLVSHGVDVVVLEAADRVGGRTLTVHPPDDDPSVPKFGWADLGASYVGPSQNHILRLCKELGLGTYLCNDKHDFIHYSKGRQFCYQTTWPNLWWSNPLAYLEVVYMCRLMDNMSKEIPLDKPWRAPRAKEWDKLTVQDFLCRHCWTKDGVEFLLALCSNNNTADGHEMSLLYYLWYMCQGGGLLNLWRVKGGAQERKIVGGSQQVCLKMAEQLAERVHLNQPVVKINYSTKGMKIHFDPPLSSLRYGLLQRSPMGLVLKSIIFFNHPFWAEKGYNGLVTCNDDIEVVGLATEDFKPGVQLAGMICFMYGDQALRMANMTEEERKKKVCKTLSNFYKTHAALKPVHYMDKIWSQDTYIGGGYTCYYPPGVLSKYGPALRESIGGCIFLAGSETALQWTGYMSGAVEAGERAAREPAICEFMSCELARKRIFSQVPKLGVQVLYSCGKISSSEVYAEEPEFVEVPIQPLEQSLLERFIPSIGFLLAVFVAIIGCALLFSSYQGQWRRNF